MLGCDFAAVEAAEGLVGSDGGDCSLLAAAEALSVARVAVDDLLPGAAAGTAGVADAPFFPGSASFRPTCFLGLASRFVDTDFLRFSFVCNRVESSL